MVGQTTSFACQTDADTGGGAENGVWLDKRPHGKSTPETPTAERRANGSTEVLQAPSYEFRSSTVRGLSHETWTPRHALVAW